MNIWEFANTSVWNSIVVLLVLALIIHSIITLWNKFWQHLNIWKHGYIPPCCDVNGDFGDNVNCDGCNYTDMYASISGVNTGKTPAIKLTTSKEDNTTVELLREMDRRVKKYKEALEVYAKKETWKVLNNEGWKLAEDTLRNIVNKDKK